MVLGSAETRVMCGKCQEPLPDGATFCGKCGEAIEKASPRHKSLGPRPEITTGQAIADPLIGATVADRYIIQSMIGRGGMGVVYKVEHAKIGKIMALKLLTGALARNPETVGRFKREAMMVSKLSHPNTVQVFDYGSAGGLTYLAMEYLNGQDLGELVEREGPQSFLTMGKIIQQACGALTEAHQFGMVHRDLKPENLFLTRTPSGEEQVKVLDFGLAKLRETPELGSITTTGNIVGTPFYMPPEQVRGEDVDARGDIYSLCALFYTCITGTFVFDAPTPVGVLTAQLHKEPIPPHERAPHLNIPPSVSALILKGLEKDPADRYQTMSEFETALRGELRGQSQINLHIPHSGYFKKQNDEEAATRDEVEKYERSLRRRDQFTRAAIGLGLVALCYGGYRLYAQSAKPEGFVGQEKEPNESIADATPVPLGKMVNGKLGRRMSAELSDQDNFLYQVPETKGADRSLVSLSLSPLPNMAMCAWIFQRGVEKPLHQLCGGDAGRGVSIKQLALRPADYLIAVKQDLNRYAENQVIHVHENVSDDYSLTLSPAVAEASYEKEPNDDPRGANVLSWDGTSKITGVLGTMRDRDTVCASGTGAVSFVIRDAEGGARPIHAALRVTPLGGPGDKIPVRVHGSRPTIEVTERDRPSPWTSPSVELSEGPCVELTLEPNPWAPTPHPLTPPASDQKWVVELVRSETTPTPSNEATERGTGSKVERKVAPVKGAAAQPPTPSTSTTESPTN